MGHRSLFHIFITLWATSSIALAEEHRQDDQGAAEKISLHIGQQQTIEAPENTSFRVSRRGIVDLQNIGPGKWRLTGLQNGFISIAYEPSEGETERKIFVEVTHTGASRSLVSTTQLRDLANSAGLQLDPRSMQVVGQTANPRAFLTVKSLCQKHRGCIFNAQLSAAGQQQVIDQVRKSVGDDYTVAATADGLPYIVVPCRSNELKSYQDALDFLTGGMVAAKTLGILCSDVLKPRRFKLKARVFLVDESSAQEFGFEPDLDAAFHLRTKPDFDFSSRLKDLVQKKHAKILGEPSLRLNANTEASIRSGGEVQVFHPAYGDKEQHTESWKKYGVELKVSVYPLQSLRQVKMKLDLSLSNRLPSGERLALESSNIATEIDLALDAPMILGGASIQSDSAAEASSTLFGEVPIIGPLFTTKTDDQAKSKFFIWFVVSDDPVSSPPKIDFSSEIPSESL